LFIFWCLGGSAAIAQPQGETGIGGVDANLSVGLPVPTSPGLRNLVTNVDSVVVRWFDRSDNASEFKVYKRNAAGSWTTVATVPKVVGDNDFLYQWMDTAKNISGQCYRVAARTVHETEASAQAQCTVRPEGFPTGQVDSYKKWFGLSGKNQGLGQLRREDIQSDQHLITQHQRFGVNLGLGRGQGGDNLKLQRTGNNPEPLMVGEKVAMRVWGAGWVKYGSQSFGINLQLSSTPSYEWYVLGDEIGRPISEQRIALWNSKAKAFLVPGSRTWGVQLVWKGGEATPPPGTGNPVGVKTFAVFNCSTERRPMAMWIKDVNSNAGWVESGTLQQQYNSSGSCPGNSAPWTTTLTAGHSYQIEAVDYTAPGCSNDPQAGQCIRSYTVIKGGPSGTASHTIS
jgi:hypothetical protein